MNLQSTPGIRPYASLFLVAGIIILLLASGHLLFTAALLLISIVAVPTMIVMQLLLMLLDGILIAGVIQSLLPVPRGRKLILTAAKGFWGTIGVLLVLMVVSILLAQPGERRAYSAALRASYWPWVIVAVPLVCNWLLYRLYSGARADCYFREAITPVVPIADKFDAKANARPRYRVEGIDVNTKQKVVLESKSPTEELARRSAVALGLEPESVQVSRLEQDAE